MKKILTFLKPSFSKLLIFISPLVLVSIFWFGIALPRGINPDMMQDVYETSIDSFKIPGTIICIFMPACMPFYEDYFAVNDTLYQLSMVIAYGLWYVLVCALDAPLRSLWDSIRSKRGDS